MERRKDDQAVGTSTWGGWGEVEVQIDPQGVEVEVGGIDVGGEEEEGDGSEASPDKGSLLDVVDTIRSRGRVLGRETTRITGEEEVDVEATRWSRSGKERASGRPRWRRGSEVKSRGPWSRVRWVKGPARRQPDTTWTQSAPSKYSVGVVIGSSYEGVPGKGKGEREREGQRSLGGREESERGVTFVTILVHDLPGP